MAQDDPTSPSERDDAPAEPSAADMASEALGQAEKAAGDLSRETGGPASLELPDFGRNANTDGPSAGLSMLDDVTLRVKIELGRTQMYVEDVLRLNANSVVELDKAAGDPVDIYVNERHVARGEVLVLNENFCVRVSEIIQPTAVED